MSQKLQPVRGTHDLLPEEYERFAAILGEARRLAELYAFQEMATPIFETTDVFARSMGETSDVVSKEMFTFETRGGESVTLRPEFTAGIARAFISGGMQQHLPLKLFSAGPVFRYERPQKGRQRQFHQVNYEWLGDASPQAEAEMIMLAAHLLFCVTDCKKKTTLYLNTLGDAASRKAYRAALVAFLAPHAASLSEDSQRRLQLNPLRILDSKDPKDRELIAHAPRMHDFLTPEARTHFDEVRALLSGAPENSFGKLVRDLVEDIREEPTLVRGLDYYTHTVFEFVANSDDMGAQNTVLAGGRYDGLIEHMGGSPTSAVGFAAGVERLMLFAADDLRQDHEFLHTRIVLLPMEGVPLSFAYSMLQAIRSAADEYRVKNPQHKIVVEIMPTGSLKKRLERTNKHMNQNKANYAVILGADEHAQHCFTLKHLNTRVENKIGYTKVVEMGRNTALFATLFPHQVAQ